MKKINLFLVLKKCFYSFTLILIFNCSQALSFNDKNQLETKVENFFANLSTLEAEFIQVNPSGSISNGKIFLDLPGKLRLDYIQPKNLLITCNGFWIVIQDRERKSTNNIPVLKTPFSILLNKKISFTNKKMILDLKKKLGVITLKVQLAENKDIGQLIIEFSDKPFVLKKWIIKDLMGDETTVVIQNAKFSHKIPFLLFFKEDFPEPIN